MDKVALITGASRGIGAACALQLSKSGYKIACHFRSDKEKAQNLAAEMEGSHIFQYDLSEEGACEALVKEVKAKFGRIDVLVNNAGMTADGLVIFTKPQVFDQIIGVNLKPTFLLTKAVSKMMIKQKSGSIINMSSVVGHTGNAGQALYAATKSAITSFTNSTAAELASFGIRCNNVAPGFIKTEMTDQLPEKTAQDIQSKIPLGRLGTPYEVASAVDFLASESASYITGTTIHVNGGMYTN